MLTFKCCRHQNSNEILTRTQSHHFITGKFNLELLTIKFTQIPSPATVLIERTIMTNWLWVVSTVQCSDCPSAISGYPRT